MSSSVHAVETVGEAPDGLCDRRHAQELAERGFTICRAVLTAEQVARARAIFDALLLPSSGIPVACSNAGEGGRRQLNAGGPFSGGLRAALAEFGELPEVLRSAASVMEDTRPLRLMQTPIPVVSFNDESDAAFRKVPPSQDGAPTSVRRWQGHVDWGCYPEGADVHCKATDLWQLWRFGVIHFTSVRPGGAAFHVVPRSHTLVRDYVARARHGDSHDLCRLQSLVAQNFYDNSGQPIDGLENEVEVLPEAGDIVYCK